MLRITARYTAAVALALVQSVQGKVGLTAGKLFRKLFEKYFGEFVNEHCLPLILSKLNDCLSCHAASYRALGLPSGPSALPARDRALKALRSVARYPEASRIAMELEPVSVPELVKLLEEAIEAVRGSDAADHTSLDVLEIDAELELLRAMVAAPPRAHPAEQCRCAIGGAPRGRRRGPPQIRCVSW